MTIIPDLRTALLDLLHEIRDSDIRLIIGGGFGIYLKAEHVRHLKLRTLLREWPETRSTNDLDLFLRPELLINSEKLKPLAESLTKLGYQVVTGAEKYQFVQPGPEGSATKVDILTGPQSRFENTAVNVDDRRVRPNPSVGIHAHPVDGALTLEEGTLTMSIEGKLSTGEHWSGKVILPHPYTFLMMKLFAFRDRCNDPNKEYGQYHAMDIYSILASTTEDEWRYALKLRNSHNGQPAVVEAGKLVLKYFSALDCLGMIRLRESKYYYAKLQIDEFMSAIIELFP